ERMWMRDSQSVKDQFEFLVLSRVAMLEADRIGVRISPDEVDLVVQRTRASVTDRLGRTAPGMTLDQFVQRVLQIDRTSYDRKVRTDAVLQLLTERCVRAWFLSTPRRELEMIELADEAALKAAQTALAAGTPFEEVARAHGLPEDVAAGGLKMSIARNEESDLARLAFVTPLGEVGGPVVRDDHYLLLRPVREPEVVEGPWSEIAARVEASLAADPLDGSPMQMEFQQWRVAMLRRYPVDLGPFLDLVRAATP
ncbi:MAG TPA: peptidylprolyl isomerase, partial [Planctomycetota bacterium]|nr:peptidylprolyl isomerase [Planctomycetota bacterium]